MFFGVILRTNYLAESKRGIGCPATRVAKKVRIFWWGCKQSCLSFFATRVPAQVHNSSSRLRIPYYRFLTGVTWGY